MKTFISWSGEQSRQVAEALRRWLPRVLQAVEPYMSKEDTAKGAYWIAEVKHQLDAAGFGIICLTPDNLERPWINFEAGALSKSFDRGCVAPFLFGVAQGDLTGPLTQFQITEGQKPDDVLLLIKHLNASCGDRAVAEKVAEDSFKKWWPDLEESLGTIAPPPVIHQRSTEDMVLEILNRQRVLERLVSDSARPLSDDLYMDALVRHAANAQGPNLRTELETLLRDLSLALDAVSDSDDQAIKQVAVHVAAARALCERMQGNPAGWKPLRSRVNPDRRALPPGEV